VLIFEWDPEKARDNEQKHGVAISEASEVFANDHSSTVQDPDHSIEEAALPDIRSYERRPTPGCVLY